MSDKAQSRDDAGLLSIVLWALVAIAVYFLGVGPAALLHATSKSRNVKAALKVVYSPVKFMCRWKPLGVAVEWYERQWLMFMSLKEGTLVVYWEPNRPTPTTSIQELGSGTAVICRLQLFIALLPPDCRSARNNVQSPFAFN